MKELVFHNYSASKGHEFTTVTCNADSVEPIVRWYGLYHEGDDFILRIDGVKAKLDHNNELALLNG
jgi:hypothetical protein